MCIIHLALTANEKEELLKLYSVENQSIMDVNIVLKKLKSEISKGLYSLLEEMVRENEEDRPNLIALYEQLRQFSDRRVFFADSPVNYLYSLELQKRQEEKLS